MTTDKISDSQAFATRNSCPVAFNRSVDSLDSGLKRPIIEFGFFIMVIAAVCTCTPILTHLQTLLGTLCLSLINTIGMVIIYYAMMRGMRPLYHPLTAMWWALLALNLISFVTPFLPFIDERLITINLVAAALLPMAYLPMGVLLMAWYRGRLGRLGLWMMLRIIIAEALPLVWYFTLGEAFMMVQDVVIVAVELIYAILLRNLLIPREASPE